MNDFYHREIGVGPMFTYASLQFKNFYSCLGMLNKHLVKYYTQSTNMGVIFFYQTLCYQNVSDKRSNYSSPISKQREGHRARVHQYGKRVRAEAADRYAYAPASASASLSCRPNPARSTPRRPNKPVSLLISNDNVRLKVSYSNRILHCIHRVYD